jgi:hypothetical protein
MLQIPIAWWYLFGAFIAECVSLLQAAGYETGLRNGLGTESESEDFFRIFLRMAGFSSGANRLAQQQLPSI